MMIEAKIQQVDDTLMMPISPKMLKKLEFDVKAGDTLYLVPARDGDLIIRKPTPEKRAIKTPITTADHLKAYSRGEISSGYVIKNLEMEGGFRQLLNLMCELKLPLPRGQGEEKIVRKEIDNVAPIIKKQLELAEMQSAEPEIPEMKSMIKIFIADSGPLVSLAKINRLDLVDRFKCPVVITDVVKMELFKTPTNTSDIQVLKKWFQENNNNIHIHNTTFGYQMKQIGKTLEMIPDDQKKKMARKLKLKNATELSINEFSVNIRSTLIKKDSLLVLFEDKDVRNIPFGNHVHLISNWSFIRALEEFNVIPSAEDIFDEIDDVKPCNDLNDRVSCEEFSDKSL